MIPEEKILEFRNQLEKSVRSLIFFDDDCDGLSSFILLYKAANEAKGVPIKAAPVLNDQFVHFVHEYSPDKIFVLDTTRITDEFVEGARTSISALDHHPYPEPINGVRVYNPRDYDETNSWPTTYWAYIIANKPENIWIAMVGCIGDWFMPLDLKDEFCEKYPDLLDKKINVAHDALYDSEIGKLSQIFSFALKGSTKSVLSCMKTLTRIKSPYEILREETPAGKFIMKHYKKHRQSYDTIFEKAKGVVSNDRFVIYTYEDSNMSMTAEVSNELIHMFPDKIIVIGRIKSGEYRCSLRSAGDTLVAPALESSLKSVEGYGGGHEHACGCSVKEHDFGHFIELMREYIDDNYPQN